MNTLTKRYHKPLNGKTPKWFGEWYTKEFVPYKVKQDILLVMASGILVAVIAALIIT